MRSASFLSSVMNSANVGRIRNWPFITTGLARLGIHVTYNYFISKTLTEALFRENFLCVSNCKDEIGFF